MMRSRNVAPAERNLSDSSSDRDDDGDAEEVFSKYSCTPPSRQAVKLRKRKDFRFSYRPRTPELEESESEQPARPKWKQHGRQKTVQRGSDRMDKLISTDLAARSSNTAGSGSFSSGDEDSAADRPKAATNLHHGITVVRTPLYRLIRAAETM